MKIKWRTMHLPSMWVGAATQIATTIMVLVLLPGIERQPRFWLMQAAVFLVIVWGAYQIGKGKERPEKVETAVETTTETESDAYHLANVIFFPETGAIKFEFSDGGSEEITTHTSVARLAQKLHGAYGVGSNLISCVMHLALHNLELEKRIQRLEETRGSK
jgi:hypothetical protein